MFCCYTKEILDVAMLRSRVLHAPFFCWSIGIFPNLSWLEPTTCLRALIVSVGTWISALHFAFRASICRRRKSIPLAAWTRKWAIWLAPSSLQPMGRLLRRADSTWLTWPSALQLASLPSHVRYARMPSQLLLRYVLVRSIARLRDSVFSSSRNCLGSNP